MSASRLGGSGEGGAGYDSHDIYMYMDPLGMILGMTDNVGFAQAVISDTAFQPAGAYCL